MGLGDVHGRVSALLHIPFLFFDVVWDVGYASPKWDWNPAVRGILSVAFGSILWVK